LPACLAASLVLSVVVGLGLVTWQWRRAEANLLLAETQRHHALVERARADEGFREAHRAVQEFCTRASEGKLRNVPGAQAVRKELLEAALTYYERFLRERGQDASLRAELAAAHLRIGLLCGVLGSNSRGLAACREAQAIYREMLHDDPANVPLRSRLAVALTEIGFFKSQSGEVAAALDSLAEARALYEALCRERANDPFIRGTIADVLTSTANAQARAGRMTDAIASYDQARQIQEELNRRSPGDAIAKERLASFCLNLAGAHRSLGNRAETARFSRQARDLLEGLVKADPGNFHCQRDLAAASRLVAAGLPPTDALPMARRGHALLVRLCDLEPGMGTLQGELASSHRLLGHLSRKLGRNPEALAEYEKALALLEPVVRKHPEVTDFQNDLARCHFDRGFMRLELGKPALALESFTKARDVRRSLVKANPRNATYRTDLGLTLINLAATLAELNRKPEALEAARQAVQEHEIVFAAAPKIPRYRATLTHALKGRVRLSLENGLPAEAANSALELKKLWPTNGKELYEAAKILAHAAVVAGKDSEPANRPPDAQRYADLAVARLREAVAAGLPKDARPADYGAFAVLRERRDFQEILAALQRKARNGN
jgi:tetratricopeptide (TPR) repeat protein